MPRASVALILALGLSGCAGAIREYRVGPVDGGEHLLTVRVYQDRAALERECRPLPPPTAGCARGTPGSYEGQPVPLFRILAWAGGDPYYILTHEACHIVRAALGIPTVLDPCHNAAEDTNAAGYR